MTPIMESDDFGLVDFFCTSSFSFHFSLVKFLSIYNDFPKKYQKEINCDYLTSKKNNSLKKPSDSFDVN